MSGPRDGEALQIEVAGSPPSVAFGRNSDCAVSLPDDPEISRRHARLVRRDESWWLEDLGSTNGTFIGEFAAQQRISAAIRIDAGLVFRVGLSRFRVEKNPTIARAHDMMSARA
jgi:pSer/pThr/pTyr-binding forkhead associated (FHA) protein